MITTTNNIDANDNTATKIIDIVPTTETTDYARQKINPDATTLDSSGARHMIGFVPEGESARKIQDGPLIEGPWAYSFGICSVIDNNGGTGREKDVRAGDVLRLPNGLLFRVHFVRNDSRWLELDLIDASDIG